MGVGVGVGVGPADVEPEPLDFVGVLLVPGGVLVEPGGVLVERVGVLPRDGEDVGVVLWAVFVVVPPAAVGAPGLAGGGAPLCRTLGSAPVVMPTGMPVIGMPCR